MTSRRSYFIVVLSLSCVALFFVPFPRMACAAISVPVQIHNLSEYDFIAVGRCVSLDFNRKTFKENGSFNVSQILKGNGSKDLVYDVEGFAPLKEGRNYLLFCKSSVTSGKVAIRTLIPLGDGLKFEKHKDLDETLRSLLEQSLESRDTELPRLVLENIWRMSEFYLALLPPLLKREDFPVKSRELALNILVSRKYFVTSDSILGNLSQLDGFERADELLGKLSSHASPADPSLIINLLKSEKQVERLRVYVGLVRAWKIGEAANVIAEILLTNKDQKTRYLAMSYLAHYYGSSENSPKTSVTQIFSPVLLDEWKNFIQTDRAKKLRLKIVPRLGSDTEKNILQRETVLIQAANGASNSSERGDQVQALGFFYIHEAKQPEKAFELLPYTPSRLQQFNLNLHGIEGDPSLSPSIKVHRLQQLLVKYPEQKTTLDVLISSQAVP